MIYSVKLWILSYQSPKHCYSYVVITRYFHITCKCIFYLKVGRENCDHNAQGDLFRELCGYHKSWKQNFWLCQNGLHVKHWPAHHVSLRLRQKLIYIDFQFAAKTLAFQDNFLQFQIFLSFI